MQKFFNLYKTWYAGVFEIADYEWELKIWKFRIEDQAEQIAEDQKSETTSAIN